MYTPEARSVQAKAKNATKTTALARDGLRPVLGAGGLAAQFFALLQQVHRLTGSARTDRFCPLDLAVLADEYRRAVGNARLIEPRTVGLGDLAFGLEIGQQGEVDSTKAIRPCLVAELAIDTDTQNLGIAGLELAPEGFKTRNLDASGRCEIEWVEDEQDVLLALEARQAHRFHGVAVQLEVGRGGSGSDHCCGMVRGKQGSGASPVAEPGRLPDSISLTGTEGDELGPIFGFLAAILPSPRTCARGLACINGAG